MANFITLNDNQYEISGPIQEKTTSPWTSRITSVNEDFGSYMPASIIEHADMRGGLGLENTKAEGDRFWFAKGIETTKERFITLNSKYNRIVDALAATTAANPIIGIDYKGVTYFIENSKVEYMVGDVVTDSAAATPDPLATPTDAMVFKNATDSYLLVCNGSEVLSCTNALVTTENWSQLTANDIKYMAIFDRRCIGITATGTTVYHSDTQDALNFTSSFTISGPWTAAYDLFSGILPSSGTSYLFMVTDAGLVMIDFYTKTAELMEVRFPSSNTKAYCGMYWNGELYVSSGAGIVKIGVNLVTQWGPDQDDGLPEDYHGYIRQLIGTAHWVIAVLDNGVVLKRHESVGGWHVVEEGTAKYGAFYSSLTSPGRLWLWEYATPYYPYVTNGTGVTALTATTATLNGEIVSTDGVNPTVHVYWGLTDGGTTAANWATDVNLGATAVGAFSTNIASLAGGTKYYYRCAAVGVTGIQWATKTLSFIPAAANIRLGGSTGTTGYGWGANCLGFQKFTALYTGTAKTIKIVCGGNGNVKVALFDSDSSNHVTTMIATDVSAAAVIAGTNTITLDAPTPITAGKTYWIGAIADAADVILLSDTNSVNFWSKGVTYGTFTHASSPSSLTMYQVDAMLSVWGDTGSSTTASEPSGASFYPAYIQFPDMTHDITKSIGFTFAPTGDIVFPRFSKLGAIAKTAKKVELLTAGCSATETIAIYYRINSTEDTTWTLLSTVTSNGLSTINFASGAGIAFYDIQLKAVFSRGESVTSTPILKSLILKYVPNPPAVQQWSFVVDARGDDTPKIISGLETARDSTTLVNFSPVGDLQVSTRYVKVQSLVSQQTGFLFNVWKKYTVVCSEVG